MRRLILIALVPVFVSSLACQYRDPPTGPTVITNVTATGGGGTGGNGGAGGGGTPTPGTPTPTPTPGGGTGNRTPDPPTGTALPLPAYGAQVLQLYVAQSGGASLPLACPTGNANSWGFMDGLVDQLRQKDTRWGYFCRRGNCFDPSNDVIGYHATAGPETTGAAGVIGVDVIGDLCGTNVAQWLPLAFDQAALWTSRGRF